MDIGKYLEEQGVEFEIHEHPAAYTAQEVAAEEHVSGDMMAKAVVVCADGDFAICALPASHKLDMEKVAEALGAKKARLADEGEMARLFPDVEVGAEPPLGHLWGLPTIVDEHLAADEEIVFQAGTHRHAVRMRYADYASLTKPKVAALAVHL
jgi:Ala-tRNA(Pro) deacylase